MIDYYSTIKENGKEGLAKKIDALTESGYEIINIIEDTMVPRGAGIDGQALMVPGYLIIVDDGRQPYYREKDRDGLPRWLWD